MALRKAISYDRVSGATQAKKGRGLERQELDAATWAAANGYELDETLHFRDAGKSASKGAHIAEGGALRRLLDMASTGQLAPGTVLLVEALDRLSRIEPLDALSDIFRPLIKAGLQIVTIEDAAVYDRDRLAADPSALLVLTIKIQAAAEFSQRLARRQRSRWKQDRETLRQGKIVRPELFRCAWLDWNAEDRAFELNSYAPTARLALEMLRDYGLLGVARELNRRGLLSPSGKRWTGAAVNQLLQNTSIEGTITLNKNRRGAKAREAMADHALVEESFPGMLPELVSPEEATTLRAIVAGRANQNAPAGPTGATLFVGQGLVWCTCGSRAGVVTSSGQNRRHHYVRCRRRYSDSTGCRGFPFRLKALTANLLTRLRSGELRLLLSDDRERDAAAALQQKAVAELTDQLALVEQKKQRAADAWRAAVLDGGDPDLIVDLRDLLTEARLRTEEVRAALAAARTRLASIAQEVNTGEVDADVVTLLEAFSKGEDTPEMRRTVQLGLKRLGVRLELDPAKQALGISVAGSQFSWAPVHVRLDQAGLAAAMTGTITVDFEVDGDVLAKIRRLADEAGIADLGKALAAAGIGDGGPSLFDAAGALDRSIPTRVGQQALDLGRAPAVADADVDG